METGQNCTDCISAKATVTRSGLKLDACKNCEKNNLKARDEKVSRQIRQLCRKNNHHLTNGFIKPKDQIRQNGLIKKPKENEKQDSEENSKSEDLVLCKWLNCDRSMDSCELMDHLRQAHVDTQSSSEMFVCLWTGCKVYDKSSCSMSWLERHVVSHSGAKPFKCLFDGCGSRFTSQVALERHINTHFKHISNMQQKMAKNSQVTTPSKVKRRKRKRKLYKEVCGQDYFDQYTLDGIRLGLYRMETKTGLDTNSGPKPTATFQPSVICRRVEPSGAAKLLLQWSPQNVLPDTWLSDTQLNRSRDLSVPVHQLPTSNLANLDSCLYRPHRFRKHRRK